MRTGSNAILAAVSQFAKAVTMLNQPEPMASEGIRKVFWGLKAIKVITKNNEQAVLCLRQSDLIAILVRLMRDNLVGKKQN